VALVDYIFYNLYTYVMRTLADTRTPAGVKYPFQNGVTCATSLELRTACDMQIIWVMK